MALDGLCTLDPPKRIMMTTDTIGGVWSYSIDLARWLCANGSTVLLASMGRMPTESQRREARGIPRLLFAPSAYPLEWMPAVTNSDLSKASAWLMRLAQAFRPEIVHLNEYVYASSRWGVPVVVVAHSCVYSWWLAVHGCLPPAEWQPYKDRVERGLASAAAVVAPSKWMEQSLHQLYSCDSRVTHAIPNFSGLKSSPAPKLPQIFAAGRFWDKAKNLQILEEVAAGVDWPVHVAGDLRSPENEYPEPRNVKAEGFLSRDDLAKRLAETTIFVHPAKYEPFGLSVLEAARSGCALVLSDIPTLRELWDGCALFAPPDDAAAWTNSINQLIASAAERDDCARRALARSEAFSTLNAAVAYVRLYRSLIDECRHTRLSA